ncbi:La-related protein 7 [Phytophthora citrophthora]|uniref:La-related protein 7 n=1 Tax=Phytophthora citrophthora TaxID=4793 RepID=A0AAD9GXK9_9STRA|nr:La-related protein 7 [Phytophthora citrophthora]
MVEQQFRLMEARPTGKSQRKRLQRQLEFYLSESNLRQDKFLQQAMDEQSFVPASVFLSFNKLKALKATERMILDEADKSPVIRVDRTRSCIGPKIVPVAGQTQEADARTIYIDSFSAADDHDSLRRTFAKFGKVNLVSLPRFQQSKRFKGFGFVEFSDQSAADKAAAASSDADMGGIRVMTKTRWIGMKEQLKHQLTNADASAASSHPGSVSVPDDAKNTVDSQGKSEQKKRKRRKQTAAEHIHFSGDDGESNDGEDTTTKKQKI